MIDLLHDIVNDAKKYSSIIIRVKLTVDEQRNYELVMAITPVSNSNEIGAIIDKIETYINDNGGVVTEKNEWGVKRLSFPVNKLQEGNYMHTLFSVQASAIKELERSLNLNEDILIHMVSRV